jgi:hypothetical protein
LKNLYRTVSPARVVFGLCYPLCYPLLIRISFQELVDPIFTHLWLTLTHTNVSSVRNEFFFFWIFCPIYWLFYPWIFYYRIFCPWIFCPNTVRNNAIITFYYVIVRRTAIEYKYLPSCHRLLTGIWCSEQQSL